MSSGILHSHRAILSLSSSGGKGWGEEATLGGAVGSPGGFLLARRAGTGSLGVVSERTDPKPFGTDSVPMFHFALH